MLFFGLFQTVLPQLVLCFCWPKKSAVRGPSVVNKYYLVDPEEKLFFDSSAPADEVLLGIKDLPGDEFFLAGGGGVFRLFGTGDFSFKIVAAACEKSAILGFSLELLLSSLRIGKFLWTGGGVDCSIKENRMLLYLVLGLGLGWPEIGPWANF